MSTQDLWESCYSSEHRSQISPEEFKKTFCAQCMNTNCRNSRGSSTSWAKRISEQEEKLLRNPVFSEPGDPRFSRLSGMDFQEIVREAISIKISEERGDWSIPTKEEIGREAAALIGVAPPVSWKPPVEAVEPPKEETPKKENSWKVVGDKGALWEVYLLTGGSWGCTCPAFTHKKQECKHILDVRRKIQRSPKIEEPQELTMPPPGVAPIFKPAGSNTKVPDGGIFLGGGSEPKEEDPWALPPSAPPLNERVIPVGGRVQFKK